MAKKKTCKAHVAHSTSDPRMVAKDGYCSDSCRMTAKTERVADLEAGLALLAVAIRRGTPNSNLLEVIEALLVE